MWTCPKCETLNENDNCIICGEPKPVEPMTYNYIFDKPTPSRVEPKREVDTEENENIVIKIVVAAVAIILILFLFAVGSGNV